jgi:hypothetical protein
MAMDVSDKTVHYVEKKKNIGIQMGQTKKYRYIENEKTFKRE